MRRSDDRMRGKGGKDRDIWPAEPQTPCQQLRSLASCGPVVVDGHHLDLVPGGAIHYRNVGVDHSPAATGVFSGTLISVREALHQFFEAMQEVEESVHLLFRPMSFKVRLGLIHSGHGLVGPEHRAFNAHGAPRILCWGLRGHASGLQGHARSTSILPGKCPRPSRLAGWLS